MKTSLSDRETLFNSAEEKQPDSHLTYWEDVAWWCVDMT